MKHLKYDLYNAIGKDHPQEVMKELGIDYKLAVPQSMGDQWWFFCCEGYVDELYVTIIPTIIGKGKELFEKTIENEIKLDLDGILQYGDQVVLHYLVKK